MLSTAGPFAAVDDLVRIQECHNTQEYCSHSSRHRYVARHRTGSPVSWHSICVSLLTETREWSNVELVTSEQTDKTGSTEILQAKNGTTREKQQSPADAP